MKETKTEQSDATSGISIPCSFWRRIMAMVYDSILLFCVVFVLWFPMILLPHESMPKLVSQSIRLAYLVAIAYLYFGWFWTHGGQTLGMRSWKIKLVPTSFARQTTPDQINISWLQAWRRYAASYLSWIFLGAGFFWCLFDSKGLSWHDRLSDSELRVFRQ